MKREARELKNQKFVILLTTFVLWGSLYIVSKLAMQGIPPVLLLAFRYLLSIPLLFILLISKKNLQKVGRFELKVVARCGLLGYFGSFVLQMLGIARLSGGTASLLGAMNPVFIPVLAAMFLGEKLEWQKIICVLLSMAGVFLVASPGGNTDLIGVLLMLLSVFLWSITSILLRRISGCADPMQIAMMAMCFAIVPTFAIGLCELRTQALTLTAGNVLAVVYMAVFGTAMAHTCWNTSLANFDASFCALFYPLQPLVSGVLGVLILHEQVTSGLIGGFFLISLGIVIASGLRNQQNRS